MFSPANSVRVFIATGYTDMRKSINGLSILVSEQLDLDPFSGHLFAFCNRKRDIIKILYWDCNGFCIWHKRLERDRFQWPETEEDIVDINGRELAWLLDGLTLTQLDAHQQLYYKYLT